MKQEKRNYLEPEKSNSVSPPPSIIDMAEQSSNLKIHKRFTSDNKKKLLKDRICLSPIEEQYFKREQDENLGDWLSRIAEYRPISRNGISDVYACYFLDKDKASKKERKELRDKLSESLEKNILGYKDGEYYKRNSLWRILKLK